MVSKELWLKLEEDIGCVQQLSGLYLNFTRFPLTFTGHTECFQLPKFLIFFNSFHLNAYFPRLLHRLSWQLRWSTKCSCDVICIPKLSSITLVWKDTNMTNWWRPCHKCHRWERAGAWLVLGWHPMGSKGRAALIHCVYYTICHDVRGVRKQRCELIG